MWENLHSGMAAPNRRTYFLTHASQNSTLRTSTSRSSNTTKIFRAYRRLVSPIRSKNHLRPRLPHSHFPPSFSRLKRATVGHHRGSRYCARHPAPSSVKRASPSSSAFRGVPRTTRSLTLLSRHHLLRLQPRRAPTSQLLKHHWSSAGTSYRPLCGASALVPRQERERSRIRARSGARARHRAAPSRTARRCASSSTASG